MSGGSAFGPYSRADYWPAPPARSGRAFPAIPNHHLLTEADMIELTAPDTRQAQAGTRTLHYALGISTPNLPGNAGFAAGLVMAARALDRLDQARCLVIGMEVGFQAATIRLAREPSAVLAVTAERVTHTGPGGDRIQIQRGRFMGVTLEWRDCTP